LQHLVRQQALHEQVRAVVLEPRERKICEAGPLVTQLAQLELRLVGGVPRQRVDDPREGVAERAARCGERALSRGGHRDDPAVDGEVAPLMDRARREEQPVVRRGLFGERRERGLLERVRDEAAIVVDVHAPGLFE
jgi:hypothetical protein